jgi:hypothetical protein
MGERRVLVARRVAAVTSRSLISISVSAEFYRRATTAAAERGISLGALVDRAVRNMPATDRRLVDVSVGTYRGLAAMARQRGVPIHELAESRLVQFLDDVERFPPPKARRKPPQFSRRTKGVRR